jgi:hypothetical protein
MSSVVRLEEARRGTVAEEAEPEEADDFPPLPRVAYMGHSALSSKEDFAGRRKRRWRGPAVAGGLALLAAAGGAGSAWYMSRPPAAAVPDVALDAARLRESWARADRVPSFPAAAVAAADAPPPVEPRPLVPAGVRAPERASRPLDDVERRVAVRIVQRGMELLRERQVYSARRMFQMAVQDREPYAAVGMAQSYDPQVLRIYGVTAVRPDPARQRQWLAKSEELFEYQWFRGREK